MEKTLSSRMPGTLSPGDPPKVVTIKDLGTELRVISNEVLVYEE